MKAKFLVQSAVLAGTVTCNLAFLTKSSTTTTAPFISGKNIIPTPNSPSRIVKQAILMSSDDKFEELKKDRALQSMESGKSTTWQNIKKQLVELRDKIGLMVMAALFVISSFPSESLAASTGGRIGGRSPSQPRSYSAPSSRSYSSPSYGGSSSYGGSYGGPATRMNLYPSVPMYNPFGFGYGYGTGVTVIGGGIGSGIGTLITLGVAATAISTVASNIARRNEIGGGWEGADDYDIGKQDVVGIQVALQCDREQANIIDSLDGIARRADTTSATGLGYTVSETCLELIRFRDDWVSAKTATGKNEFKSRFATGLGTDSSSVEALFSQALIKERSKWKKETAINVNTAGFVQSDWEPKDSSDPSRYTYAVVTLYLLVRSRNELARESMWSKFTKSTAASSPSMTSVQAALESMSAMGTTAEGVSVEAAEILWTPEARGDRLEKMDLDIQWPDLTYL